jgi:hypothetical protein
MVWQDFMRRRVRKFIGTQVERFPAVSLEIGDSGEG